MLEVVLENAVYTVLWFDGKSLRKAQVKNDVLSDYVREVCKVGFIIAVSIT